MGGSWTRLGLGGSRTRRVRLRFLQIGREQSSPRASPPCCRADETAWARMRPHARNSSPSTNGDAGSTDNSCFSRCTGIAALARYCGFVAVPLASFMVSTTHFLDSYAGGAFFMSTPAQHIGRALHGREVQGRCEGREGGRTGGKGAGAGRGGGGGGGNARCANRHIVFAWGLA